MQAQAQAEAKAQAQVRARASSNIESTDAVRTTHAVLPPLATVVKRQGLVSLASRLLALREWLDDDLQALEVALGEVDAAAGVRLARAPLTAQAAQHLLRLVGKRIRPICVMLAARMGCQDGLGSGGEPNAAVVRDFSVACELVHAATLLHDDVIDDAQERRGKPAARVLFGNSASILAGDHLLVHALRLVQRRGYHGLLGKLLDVIDNMVTAEAMQLEGRGRFSPSRENYLRVIRGKTAALFVWGLEAGAVSSGVTEDAEMVTVLRDVGLHLGMAFQLVDDVLDLAGDPSVTGKGAMTDLREGKLTWPLILAAERDADLRAELAAFAEAGDVVLEAETCAQWVRRMQQTGAIDATKDYALACAQDAQASLERLPEGKARQSLEWVVRSAVHRVS